jgi:hypothetical protein
MSRQRAADHRADGNDHPVDQRVDQFATAGIAPFRKE